MGWVGSARASLFGEESGLEIKEEEKIKKGEKLSWGSCISEWV